MNRDDIKVGQIYYWRGDGVRYRINHIYDNDTIAWLRMDDYNVIDDGYRMKTLLESIDDGYCELEEPKPLWEMSKFRFF